MGDLHRYQMVSTTVVPGAAALGCFILQFHLSFTDLFFIRPSMASNKQTENDQEDLICVRLACVCDRGSICPSAFLVWFLGLRKRPSHLQLWGPSLPARISSRGSQLSRVLSLFELQNLEPEHVSDSSPASEQPGWVWGVVPR